MITEKTDIGTMCEDLVEKIISRTEKMLNCIENEKLICENDGGWNIVQNGIVQKL